MEENKNKSAGEPVSEDGDKKIKELEAQRDEYLDGWKRAKADLINYKKEEQERFTELVRFSNETLLRDLIVVLDSFYLAAMNLPEGGAEKKGIDLIRVQLEDILRKHGLEKIRVLLGEKFDPSRHEAIADTPSVQPEGTVAEEAERGYLLNGRVIRPARVKVSKGQA